MRDVAVIGVGHTKFGSHKDKSLMDLFGGAALDAVRSSNIEKKDIDAVFFGNFIGELSDGSANLSGFATDEIGLGNIPARRYEAACASSSVAFREACLLVAAGYYDIALVGGVERLYSAGTAVGTRGLATSVDGVYEINAGLTFPGVFAMAARLYSKVYDIPLEKLREKMAHVSIKNHKYGAINPKAQFYGKMGNLSVADVISSKVICSPLTLLDCCPMTDGATAAVVAEAKLAEDLVDKPIYVLGTGQASGGALFRQKEDIVRAIPRKKSVEMAFKEAKLTPKDIDLVEIHDCFTIAEIIATEAIGFFEYGKGADAVERGATLVDGEIPVNPDGGLIGKGHPVGATGVGQVISVVTQLRGEEKYNPVKNAEIGMTDTLGGDFGTLVNIILSVRRRER